VGGTQQIEVRTGSRQELKDVARSGVEEGVCLLFCPHTTAGVILNESWDPAVGRDIGVGLDAISPPRPEYEHAEGNSPAHLKSSLAGASQLVPVAGGRLLLGTWQGIFLAEFDGPRQRKLLVRVMGA
jgi:secondary thiamine-phosphate synthase enzyme